MKKFEVGKVYTNKEGNTVEIVKMTEKTIWYRYCDKLDNPDESNPIFRAKIRACCIGNHGTFKRYEYAEIKAGTDYETRNMKSTIWSDCVHESNWVEIND